MLSLKKKSILSQQKLNFKIYRTTTNSYFFFYFSLSDRALSVGLIKQISSAASVDHLDPASDESLDSGRLHIRSNSIPNGALAAELEPLNNNKPTFVVGGSTIIPSITTNFQSINELKNSNSTSNLTPSTNNNNNNTHSSNSSLKKSSNSRRLSVKQDQLPLDSLC